MPVNRRIFSHWNECNKITQMFWLSFRPWVSSMTIYLYLCLFSFCLSIRYKSNDVAHTSFPSILLYLSYLSFLSPVKAIAVNFEWRFNFSIQLVTSDAGQNTKNGPFFRWPNIAIAWIILPKPILFPSITFLLIPWSVNSNENKLTKKFNESLVCIFSALNVCLV